MIPASFYAAVIVSRLHTVDDRMTDEWQTGNELVGIGRGTIKELSRNFPEATETN